MPQPAPTSQARPRFCGPHWLQPQSCWRCWLCPTACAQHRMHGCLVCSPLLKDPAPTGTSHQPHAADPQPAGVPYWPAMTPSRTNSSRQRELGHTSHGLCRIEFWSSRGSIRKHCYPIQQAETEIKPQRSCIVPMRMSNSQNMGIANNYTDYCWPVRHLIRRSPDSYASYELRHSSSQPP